MNRSQLGRRLRARREELGLSQTELGQRMAPPATQSQITKWETGERIPSRNRQAAYAEALDIDLVDLLRWIADVAQDETRETKKDALAARDELEGARVELHEALVEVKRFVDQYKDFHAAYQKLGPQVEEVLTGMSEMRDEIADIKRAVLPAKNAKPR